MNRFGNFMDGRYGLDTLTIAIVAVSMALTFFGSLFNINILSVISGIIFIVAVFRTLSRNIYKRGMENQKFLNLVSRTKKTYGSYKTKNTAKKDRRYFNCPKCAKKLSVPKGKGQIRITCPFCNMSFIKKT